MNNNVINTKTVTSFAVIAVLIVVLATSAETWACSTTSVQKGSFSIGSMKNQALSVTGAAPGDTLRGIPGQYTVKNTGTIAGAVYASLDPSSIYVTQKVGKRTVSLPASVMSKWVSIYISDANGKYLPIYVNGKAQKAVLISGSKMLAKGKIIYPKLKYSFTDDKKPDQNKYQDATFHYNVNFDMKSQFVK
jgi:hypothetical protein